MALGGGTRTRVGLVDDDVRWRLALALQPCSCGRRPGDRLIQGSTRMNVDAPIVGAAPTGLSLASQQRARRRRSTRCGLFKDLETTLLADGASASIVHLLQEEGLLAPRQLETLTMLALRSSVGSAQSSAAVRHNSSAKKNPMSRRGQHSMAKPAKVPASHLEVLAALALSCL